jgi:hypothetical protein
MHTTPIREGVSSYPAVLVTSGLGRFHRSSLIPHETSRRGRSAFETLAWLSCSGIHCHTG